MSAATLVAAADPEAVAQIRRVRSLRQMRWWFSSALALAGVIVAVPWAWQQAGEHGHRTALIVSALVGLAPVVVHRRRQRARGLLIVKPGRALPSGRVVLLCIGFGLLLLPWIASWWLLQQDGRGAALALGAAVPLVVMELAGLISGRATLAQIWLRRLSARGRDQRARLAERELDEIAWTLANGPAQNGAALLNWVETEHPDLRDQIQLAPTIDGRDRGFTGLAGVWPDTLAPGLRRDLGNGVAVTVQPAEGERNVWLTDRAGVVREISGIGGPAFRLHGWRSHAGTVVTSRLAAGPAVLVHAPVARPAAGGACQTIILVGGGQQSVPIGSTSDRKVRLAELCLRVADRIDDPAHVYDSQTPRLDVIVPAPPGSPAPVGPVVQREHDALTAATTDRLPEASATVTSDLGIPMLRLAVPGGRPVYLAPIVGEGWMPSAPKELVPSVVIVCPELDLVAIDRWYGEGDRANTISAIVALLRGEERHVHEVVHVRRDSVHAKPKRGSRAVQTHGIEFGPLTVWQPIPLEPPPDDATGAETEAA